MHFFPLLSWARRLTRRFLPQQIPEQQRRGEGGWGCGGRDLGASWSLPPRPRKWTFFTHEFPQRTKLRPSAIALHFIRCKKTAGNSNAARFKFGVGMSRLQWLDLAMRRKTRRFARWRRNFRRPMMRSHGMRPCVWPGELAPARFYSAGRRFRRRPVRRTGWRRRFAR